MEYSVYDLIWILLKKWYIILLSMCVIGGLSVFTAQQSYADAVQNYEESISETISTGVETGTLSATFLYDYEPDDLTKYLTEAKRKAEFYQRFSEELGIATEENLMNISSLAETAYSAVSQTAADLITDKRILSQTQTSINAFHYTAPPTLDETGNIIIPTNSLNVNDHLTIEMLPDNILRVTISGLEELPARQILSAYLENLESVGLSDYSIRVTMMEQESNFRLNPLRPSESAKFAKVVMEKPEKAPILVKTVGTAAAYTFVLSCFVILILTFIKDSRHKEKSIL